MNSFAGDFMALVDGACTESEATAMLLAGAGSAPSVENLVIACEILRELATPLKVPLGTIDVCGTGGDAKGTLNVSTAVALVVAAAGVPVAKHGNRAASSSSGATDVLDALGVATGLSAGAAAQQLARRGITFLAAPNYHPALVKLAPLRRRIGRRTIFNLLGPLLNPGRVTRQLVGVYDKDCTRPLAEALSLLGSRHAWVVNGNGLDEITVTGPTHVVSLRDGTIDAFELDPLDYGVALAPVEAIRGGTPAENAAAMIRLLQGEPGAYRDIVCLNAAAAFLIAGQSSDFAEGLDLCRQSIDSRAALTLLRALQQDSADER